MLTVVLAAVTMKRPAHLVLIATALWVLVPSTAGFLLAGNWPGNSAVHPAAILLGVGAFFTITSNAAAALQELKESFRTYALLASLIVFFVVITLGLRSGSGILGLFNVFFIPILGFFIARLAIRLDPRAAGTLTRGVLLIVGFVCVIVFIQWLTTPTFPWGNYLPPNRTKRPLGTLNSPLDAGMILAMAIPLTMRLRNQWLVVSLASALAVAVALTEGRVPAVLAALALGWVLITRIRTVPGFVAALVGAGATVLLVVDGQALRGLLHRLEVDDGNSRAVREVAWRYAGEHWREWTVIGGGWGNAGELKGTLLESSLESGFLILVFDLGAIPTALLLLLMIRVILGRGFRKAIPEAMAAGVGVVAAALYSGITTMSAASLMLWLVLALRAGMRTAQPATSAAESQPQYASRRLGATTRSHSSARRNPASARSISR